MTMKTEQALAFKQWRQSLDGEKRWCCLINADPDALASALALKRLLHNHSHGMDIMRINEITRPDNLAMVRYLHIPVKALQPEKIHNYDLFALVDSQPNHNPAFAGIKFKLIVDHHAYTNLVESLAAEAYCDIRPEIGATSTMFAQLLRGLRQRPGPRLATALLYGIRTDTGAFERSGGEEDLMAFQWLSKYAENAVLRRIMRSEYLRSWLPYFSRAFRSIQDCKGGGAYARLNEVPSADLIVSVADFFTKVHGLKWIAVSGILRKTVIVVFRGDGGRDIGRLADACFYDVGTAGGHKIMGRAEFPLSAVPEGVKPGDFIFNRLMTRKLRPQSHIQPPNVIALPADNSATIDGD